MNFTLYPIHGVEQRWDRLGFDLERLPFELVEGVRIERVRFPNGAFDLWRQMVGEKVANSLQSVRFALVHRYNPAGYVIGQQVVGEHAPRVESEKLVRFHAACLRLIRPMRQHVFLVHGDINEQDGSFQVHGFDVPPSEFVEVPEIQKLFVLRNRDADDLRHYMPAFLQCMRGGCWKLAMALHFHELGFLQSEDWMARYLLWCSAIESIYTSNSWEHRGSLVATSRIKWFLGHETHIYPPDELNELLQDPGITVGGVIYDLYRMRNFVAHGDRIPDSYFNEHPRAGIAGEVSKAEILVEAASFIIRRTLLKILEDRLWDHFRDAALAEAYFGAQGFTKTRLRQAKRGQKP
jgi:hypothetical protein